MYGTDAIIEEQVIDHSGIHILYPRVRKVGKETEEIINQLIKQEVERLMTVPEWSEENTLTMEGTYEVTLNQRGLLSIRFKNFVNIEHAAHPTTIIRSITVDLNTGEEYELYDFFRNMSGHALMITNFIRQELEKQNIPLIIDLKLIPDNHPYYLTEDTLIVYFQEAEIAPRSFGILEFPIPYLYLKSIFENDSPLQKLL